MVVACQGKSYVLNTWKNFLKIPSFTILYLLGVCILFSQGVSSPSRAAKDDNLEERSEAIFVMKFWSVTWRYTDGQREGWNIEFRSTKKYPHCFHKYVLEPWPLGSTNEKNYVSVVSIEHTVCLIESLEQPTYFVGRWVDTSWVTCTLNWDIRESRSN